MGKQSSSRGQPEYTFFVDNDIGEPVANVLRERGLTVEFLGDHFAPFTDDVIWIPQVAAWGWVVLTMDKSQGRNDREIELYIEHGLRGFTVPQKVRHQEFADLILRSMVRIDRYLKHCHKNRQGGFLAKVKPDPKRPQGKGHVERWMDQETFKAKIEKRLAKQEFSKALKKGS